MEKITTQSTWKYGLFAIVLVFGIFTAIHFFINPRDQQQVATNADLKLSTYADHTAQTFPSTTPSESYEDQNLAAAANSKAKCALRVTFVAGTIVSNTVPYTLTIMNNGRGTCDSPSVSAYYAEDQSFVSAVPVPSASDYYWKLANLSSGGSTSIVFTLRYVSTDTTTSGDTEVCATANNGADACQVLTHTITGTGGNTTGGTIPPPVPVPNLILALGKEYGSWVWDSPLQMSTSYENSILAAAAANKMTVLYVTIDDYLTINAMPAGTSKDSQKQTYIQKLNSLISLGKTYGIAVDVEAGWRDWAEDPTFAKAKIINAFVKEFNTTHTNQIRKLQYDVEPYLLPDYETNKSLYLSNFVKMVSAITTDLGTSSIGLSIVIPHFYDDAQAWTPSFSYGGVTTYTFNHLLRVLDTRPNSDLLIMAYRNFAQGTNGSIEISNVEVQEASTGTHSTHIIVAEETGNVQPSYVTFYNTSKNTYLAQTQLLINALTTNSNFGGIAAHYIDPFMALN